MKCGLCHRHVDKLSRSHIIPKSLLFHEQPEGTREPLLLMPSNPDQRVVRSQTGIYSQIACADCEASFQRGDDALLDLCRNFENGVPVPNNGEVPVLRFYPDLSTSDLHLGVLATLYRAHLSSHPAFNRVDLGEKHAEAIRRLLVSGQPTERSPYRVVLRTVPGVQGTVVGSPFRERWEGVNAYRVYFPHITAFVKVDQRDFRPPFHIAHLGALLFNGQPCPHVIAAEHLAGAEKRVLAKIMAGRDTEVARYADNAVARTRERRSP